MKFDPPPLIRSNFYGLMVAVLRGSTVFNLTILGGEGKIYAWRSGRESYDPCR